MKSQAEKLRNKKYYFLAHQGSKDLSHPAMKILIKLFEESNDILDMGCGEGTRLTMLAKVTNAKDKKLIGIDASDLAIKSASENNPRIDFLTGNLEKLPFKNNEFDLLYSAYVFEHLIFPEKVIKEAQRVLKKDGKLMIIAPNYGSPNRRSPNSKEDKIKKILRGLKRDFNFSNQKNISLNWTSVTPKTDTYVTDADTTVEPYLLSLVNYCQNLGFAVEYYSSNWNVDKFSLFQLPFKILGKLGIFPFKYWGPHLAIVLKK